MAGINDGNSGMTFFEQQRAELVGVCGKNLDAVLLNVRKVNDNLATAIVFGKEIGELGELWSNFQNAMTPNHDAAEGQADEDATAATTTASSSHEQKP